MHANAQSSCPHASIYPDAVHLTRKLHSTNYCQAATRCMCKLTMCLDCPFKAQCFAINWCVQELEGLAPGLATGIPWNLWLHEHGQCEAVILNDKVWASQCWGQCTWFDDGGCLCRYFEKRMVHGWCLWSHRQRRPCGFWPTGQTSSFYPAGKSNAGRRLPAVGSRSSTPPLRQ